MPSGLFLGGARTSCTVRYKISFVTHKVSLNRGSDSVHVALATRSLLDRYQAIDAAILLDLYNITEITLI